MNRCYRVLLSSVAIRWAKSIWVWFNDTLDSKRSSRYRALTAHPLPADTRLASRVLERATCASVLQMAQGTDPPSNSPIKNLPSFCFFP